MEKIVSFKASQREIIELLNQHFDPPVESIVAEEELGNQVWVTTVAPTTELDRDCWVDDINNGKYQFGIGIMLNMLCDKGVLEAGEYMIDCTW